MELNPEGSVYSYFLFMPVIEQRRDATKRWATPLTMLAFMLVGVNLVMQFGLLSVVGAHIIKRHSEWVGSIAYLKHKAWYHLFPMPYNKPPGKCRTAQSPLCFDIGGQISCSPPSVQVLGDWNVLDTDGDGVWTRDEASDWETREEVNCRHNLDLLALYDSVTHSLNRSHVLEDRRDPKLRSGQGINKAYLDWYLHKPLMCMYGDEDMCGNLFTRGFFDAALKLSPIRAFKDATTAMQYCKRILRHECFTILPSTYKVWRLLSNQQCGEKRFGQGIYQDPRDEEKDFVIPTPVLTVDFKKRETYEVTRGLPFRLFLTILLITFTSVMYLEMKSMIKYFTWTIFFPADKEALKSDRHVSRQAVQLLREPQFSARSSLRQSARAAASQQPSIADETVEEASQSVEDGLSEDTVYKINMVRTDHRCMVGVITVLRMCLWFFLLYSGVMFLTGAPRFLNLIFDALSLVFIFEIDELLYKNMIREEFVKEHMEILPMCIPAPSWTSKNKVWIDITALFGVVMLCIIIVWTYCSVELNPLYNSLSCVCLSDGPQCLEATKYSKAWWDTYWTTTFPKANTLIDRLVES